jgi:hypothetical protein
MLSATVRKIGDGFLHSSQQAHSKFAKCTTSTRTSSGCVSPREPRISRHCDANSGRSPWTKRERDTASRGDGVAPGLLSSADSPRRAHARDCRFMKRPTSMADGGASSSTDRIAPSTDGRVDSEPGAPLQPPHSLMKRLVLVALVALVAGTCAILAVPYFSRCHDGTRLDLLFGGGAPVCLGGYVAGFDRYADVEASPDDSSEERILVERGRMYSYSPGRGFDLILTRLHGRIISACVEGLPQGTPADWLQRRAADQLGGTWAREDVHAPYGRYSRWTSDDGVRVWAVHGGRTCITLLP